MSIITQQNIAATSKKLCIDNPPITTYSSYSMKYWVMKCVYNKVLYLCTTNTPNNTKYYPQGKIIKKSFLVPDFGNPAYSCGEPASSPIGEGKFDQVYGFYGSVPDTIREDYYSILKEYGFKFEYLGISASFKNELYNSSNNITSVVYLPTIPGNTQKENLLRLTFVRALYLHDYRELIPIIIHCYRKLSLSFEMSVMIATLFYQPITGKPFSGVDRFWPFSNDSNTALNELVVNERNTFKNHASHNLPLNTFFQRKRLLSPPDHKIMGTRVGCLNFINIPNFYRLTKEEVMPLVFRAVSHFNTFGKKVNPDYKTLFAFYLAHPQYKNLLNSSQFKTLEKCLHL